MLKILWYDFFELFYIVIRCWSHNSWTFCAPFTIFLQLKHVEDLTFHQNKAQLEQKRFIFMTSLAHTAHTWSNSVPVDVSSFMTFCLRSAFGTFVLRGNFIQTESLNLRSSVKLRKRFRIQRMTSFKGV